MNRYPWTAATFAVCLAWLAVAANGAETYPSKPIRLIITFPPGGSTDTMARALQPHLEKRLGQPIVIENRPGAGGAIGIEAVARAVPDGYVIGVGAAGALSVNVSLNEKLPYDPFTDLAPISGLGKSPFLLAATLSFPADSLQEAIAFAKSNPAAVAIGHGGNGTAMHLTAQLFNHMAGLNVTLIPYRGTGPATQDVVAGHVPLAITDTPSSIGQIQAKQLKILAVSTKERFDMLPDIPTFDESGLPGYESMGWFGFVAPAGTPPEIIAKLNEAIVSALKDQAAQDQFRRAGAIPMPMSPQEFGTFIRAEYIKWAKLVSESSSKK